MKILVGVLLVLLVSCSGNTSTGHGQQGLVTCEDSCTRPDVEKIERAIRHLKGSDYYDYVFTHIHRVRIQDELQGGQSGILWIKPYYIRAVSIPWLASVFVHEARHIEMNHHGTDVEQEADAIRYQIPALIDFGGTKHEIGGLVNLIGVHGE